VVPAETCGWYQSALGHLPDEASQHRVDALGELGMLQFTCGDYGQGGAWANSIALAESSGMLDSPWAWFARSAVELVTGRPEDLRVSADRAIAAGRDRGNMRCEVLARGMMAFGSAMLGAVDRASELSDEMLSTARQSGDPSLLATALYAAAILFASLPEPDLAATARVLESNPVDLDTVDRMSQMGLDSSWGLAYLGQGRLSLSAEHTCRAIRLADRTGNTQTIYGAMWALAVLCARSGQLDLAAQLVGYARANFATYRVALSFQVWFERTVEMRLAQVEPTVRSRGEQTGAALDRRGFLQLVANAEQRITESEEPA
jgi:hypothetical protein